MKNRIIYKYFYDEHPELDENSERFGLTIEENQIYWQEWKRIRKKNEMKALCYTPTAFMKKHNIDPLTRGYVIEKIIENPFTKSWWFSVIFSSCALIISIIIPIIRQFQG